MNTIPSRRLGEHLLSTGTLAALVILVLLPVGFIVLQAVFPELGAGSWERPFAAWQGILADPVLPELIFNTLRLGLSVVVAAAVVGIPLGIVRGLFRVPLAPMWDVLILLPFLIPPYIAAMGWIMLLQPGGYLQQTLAVHAGDFLYSFWGVVFV